MTSLLSFLGPHYAQLHTPGIAPVSTRLTLANAAITSVTSVAAGSYKPPAAPGLPVPKKDLLRNHVACLGDSIRKQHQIRSVAELERLLRL